MTQLPVSSPAIEHTLTPPAGPARYTGLGLAALVHVALLVGLIQGFTRPGLPKPPGKTEVVLKADTPRPPEPAPPTPVELPKQLRDLPLPPRAVVPEFEVQREASPNDIQIRQDGPAVVDFSPRPVAGDAPVQPPVRQDPGVRQAGMVCTQMASPELPALNWSGEAVFKILATVREGRVVATELLAAQGALDAKTRRQLMGAVERALRDHYVCPGNHRFEQEFAFRVD